MANFSVPPETTDLTLWSDEELRATFTSLVQQVQSWTPEDRTRLQGIILERARRAAQSNRPHGPWQPSSRHRSSPA